VNLTWSEKAWDDYLSWQHDKQTWRRINVLIKDIKRSPFEGIGKPEPLKGEFSSLWSRRINDFDRIISKYENGAITIAACRGHYG